jgi:hypothetical protein
MASRRSPQLLRSPFRIDSLGLSLFNPGLNEIDFPNLRGDPRGYVASQVVQEVSAVAPGRVQLQADDLDMSFAQSEIKIFASQSSDFVGWQTNKHAGTGAGCSGGETGSCNPDGPNSPVTFAYLLYLEGFSILRKLSSEDQKRTISLFLSWHYVWQVIHRLDFRGIFFLGWP